MSSHDQTKALIGVASFFLFIGAASYARAIRRPDVFALVVWVWILILILTK
jgi:hypothetical protein